jgi:hypothetical protein
MTAADTSERGRAGVPLASRAARTIPVFAFGMSLSLFFTVSFVVASSVI